MPRPSGVTRRERANETTAQFVSPIALTYDSAELKRAGISGIRLLLEAVPESMGRPSAFEVSIAFIHHGQEYGRRCSFRVEKDKGTDAQS